MKKRNNKETNKKVMASGRPVCAAKKKGGKMGINKGMMVLMLLETGKYCMIKYQTKAAKNRKILFKA
jgi:hypothetical protein